MTDTTPTCRAPGHRCVDMRDCYTSKGCQYAPDDSGVVFLEPTAADLAPFAAYREIIEAPTLGEIGSAPCPCGACKAGL